MIEQGLDLLPSRPGHLFLRTPFLAAAGCIGYVIEAAGAVDLSRFGAAVTRGTTLTPRHGSGPPRMVETPSGLLSAIGLQNPGIDHVLDRLAPRWVALHVPVILNLWASSPQDAAALAERADGVPGVAGLELDLRGLDAPKAEKVTRAARTTTELPLIAKISPGVSDLRAIARAVADAGADAITCGGGLPATVMDPASGTPLLGDPSSAILSGPATRPIVLRAVSEVASTVTVPVLACGGITDLSDALEYLAVGARAVQIGVAMLADPALPARMAEAHAMARGLTRGYSVERAP